MEYELEEMERDYIEFRKEMGEYNIEILKNCLIYGNDEHCNVF